MNRRRDSREAMGSTGALTGLRAFLVITAGQIVSMLGTGLTQFALGVWVYQETGSVTSFALIALAISLPMVLLSPVAGALADRWERRRTLILSDSTAALSTAVVAALFFSGGLEVWHIYISSVVSSMARTLQGPAFVSASTALVPRQHFARASGLVQFGEGVTQIVAPAVAGWLVVTSGVGVVILIDCVTFLAALATLATISIPPVVRRGDGESDSGADSSSGSRRSGESLWSEITAGWRYVARYPGLLVLLGLFALINLAIGLVEVLVTPMVLRMADAGALGLILSLAGLGMLGGSVAIIVWGGPRRRVWGVLGCMALFSLSLIGAGARPSLAIMAAGAFFVMFWVPIINGCSQAIWQAKVPMELQGRVFALRRMVAYSTLPVAQGSAGPLADRVFEPLLAHEGPLAGSLGSMIGTGPGRGIAGLFVLLGVFCLVLSVAAAAHRGVRGVDDLPDAVGDEDQKR